MGFCGGVLYIVFTILALCFAAPFPISDGGNTIRYKTVPFMTIGLVFINCVVFVGLIAPKYFVEVSYYVSVEGYIAALKPYIDFIWTYGYRESYLREGISIGAFVTFTSMFMHADLAHLLGNMAYLWTFGRRLEDACGHGRFFAFYILSGLVANMGSVLINPGVDDIPGIGASGAIAGVMGAYLILFFDTRVTCVWILGSIIRIPFGSLKSGQIWRWTYMMPAWLLLIFFAVSNTFYALQSIQQEQVAGINYLAHYAGFVASLAIFFFIRKDMVTRYFSGRTL